MNNKEAVKVLRSNYPSSNYTMLIEAVEKAIAALEAVELAPTPNIAMVPCPSWSCAGSCCLISNECICSKNPCLIQRAQHHS